MVIESLTENWCDKDVAILHVCFQLLKNFVEQEDEMIQVIDWEQTQDTKKAKEEIYYLYNWWLERAKKEDLDQEQYNKDTEMLKRLIEIRKHLWT